MLASNKNILKRPENRDQIFHLSHEVIFMLLSAISDICVHVHNIVHSSTRQKVSLSCRGNLNSQTPPDGIAGFSSPLHDGNTSLLVWD